MEIQRHGCCFDACVLCLRLLVASVTGFPAGGRVWVFPTLDLVVARPVVVPGSSSGVLGPSVDLQVPILPGVWETSRSSSFEVMDPVFFLPLLVAPSLEAPQQGPARFCG